MILPGAPSARSNPTATHRTPPPPPPKCAGAPRHMKAHCGISWSHDGGKTFTEAYFAPSLPVRSSRAPRPSTALARCWSPRTPDIRRSRDHMTVLSSLDGGISWLPAALLDAVASEYV